MGQSVTGECATEKSSLSSNDGLWTEPSMSRSASGTYRMQRSLPSTGKGSFIASSLNPSSMSTSALATSIGMSADCRPLSVVPKEDLDAEAKEKEKVEVEAQAGAFKAAKESDMVVMVGVRISSAFQTIS